MQQKVLEIYRLHIYIYILSNKKVCIESKDVQGYHCRNLTIKKWFPYKTRLKISV